MAHHVYEGPKDKTNPAMYFPVVVIAVAVVAVVFVSGVMRGLNKGATMDAPVVTSAAKQVNVRALARPTDELVQRGRQLYSINCASCHGPEGRGDGSKGADLNPPPRNFHDPFTQWKNGATITGMWETLEKGIPGTSMAAYSLLPGDDRIALVHYIRESLVEEPPEITDAEVAQLPGPAAGGAAAALDVPDATPRIPVRAAFALLAEPKARPASVRLTPAIADLPGRALYAANCADCHGPSGEGNPAARVLAVHPYIHVSVGPLAGSTAEWVGDRAAFARLVTQAAPGIKTHGFATLTRDQIDELHAYVSALAQEGEIVE